MPDLNMRAAVRGAPIIFSATVRRLGEGSFQGLPVSDRLAVVQVEHVLRVAPSLGAIEGHEVTVLLDPRTEIAVGYRGVFFATSWVYGKGLAVREIAHRDDEASVRRAVSEIVKALPDIELTERIRESDLVALVIVDTPHAARIDERIDWDAPDWARAALKPERILSADREDARLTLLFPRARSGRFARSPKFRGGERAVLLLRPFAESAEGGQSAPRDTWTALDPRDVIDASRIEFVTKALQPEVKS